ncbi:MAG TPA: hypothetical protein VGP93_18930 [Polyangiaceae bacterium]|jgi:hypothetical protein|nr:hypothetical protein [Polyangiaceae bacterium]
MYVKPFAVVLGCSLGINASAFARVTSTAEQRPQEFASAKAGAPAPHRGIRVRAPERASQADLERYGARESASPGARNYEGGDAVIVISASAATVILAVVLLIVLL